MIKYWRSKNSLHLLIKNLICHLNFEIGIKFSNTDYIQSELSDRIYLKFKSLGYGFKKPTIFFASATIGAAIALAFKAPS